MSEMAMPVGGSRAVRGEAGVALLVTILMLVLLATVAFAALNTVARDREVSGNTSRSEASLAAADAGVAAALKVLRADPTASSLARGACLASPVPSATLGNGSSYGPDTTAACSIRFAGWGDSCMPGNDETYRYEYRVWDIRAQGTAAGGSVGRVEVTAGRCASPSQN
jgi:Tfp pilus assembly protein PilX